MEITEGLKLSEVNSIIFSCETEEELKNIFKDDFKFIDRMFFILEEINKEHNIDIGITMSNEEEIEVAIGKEGKFHSLLNDLFLDSLTEENKRRENIFVLATGIVEQIGHVFLKNGFRIIMLQNKDTEKITVAINDILTNEIFPMENLIVAVTSLGYYNRKVRLMKNIAKGCN